MKRRDVLKTLLAAPLTGIISGCAKQLHPHPLRFHVLKITLQGPFALVRHIGEQNRVTAYVPFDDADPAKRHHEFRLQDLDKVESVESGHTRYRFELKTKGLKAPQRPPYTDRCFADATVNIKGWRPNFDQYFVSIELPAPDLIAFTPPTTPVTFINGTRGNIPTNQVLEYFIDDLDDVRLHSPQLGARKPSPCSDIYQGYERHRPPYEARHNKMQPAGKMSSHQQESEFCGYGDVSEFFLGVGVPPSTSTENKRTHALNFFNEHLLPSLYPGQPVPNDKKLLSIGDDSIQAPATNNSAPRLIGAVMRSSERGPHAELEMISSIEDCQSPIVQARNSLSL
jgi:hypothetical protein